MLNVNKVCRIVSRGWPWQNLWFWCRSIAVRVGNWIYRLNGKDIISKTIVIYFDVEW